MRWERIHGDGQAILDRFPVVGGWIYRTMLHGRQTSVGTCFVPEQVAPKKKKPAKKKAAMPAATAVSDGVEPA